MKVKCIKNIFTTQDPEAPYWYPDITIGKEYMVISIEGNDYRVIGESNGPYLYPQKAFEIIDPTPSKFWVKEFDEEDGGLWYYGPPEFGPGFFEDYFDRKKKAQKIFNDYLKKIKVAGEM